MAYQIKDIDNHPVYKGEEPVLGHDCFLDLELEGFSDNERSFLAVASAESPDRDGDVIEAKGWMLKDYRKNPVVMAFHDYRRLPVGRSIEEFVDTKNNTNRLMFKPQFANYDEANLMYNLYRDKYLKGFSVGFIPKKSEPVSEEDRWGGRRYSKALLLEVSVAPVPMHQDALSEIKSFVEKGQLYIPARFLEEEKEIQVESYDEYFHVIMHPKDKFSKLYITAIDETKKLVLGPFVGEDEKELHLHSFIFPNDFDKEKALEYANEKSSIELPNTDTLYNAEEYTKSSIVLIDDLIVLGEKDFEVKKEEEEQETEDKKTKRRAVDNKSGSDPTSGGYTIRSDYSDIAVFYDTTEAIELKPYPNEHACRINDPAKYEKFRRSTREHEEKEYSVIYGKIKDEDIWETQAYRYNKEIWTEESAKEHCTAYKGTFEAAKTEEEDISTDPSIDKKLFILTVNQAIDDEVKSELRKEIEPVLTELYPESKLVILEEGTLLTCIGDDTVLVPLNEKAGAVLNKSNKTKLTNAISLIGDVIASAEKEEEVSEEEEEVDSKDIITLDEPIIPKAKDVIKITDEAGNDVGIKEDDIKGIVKSVISEMSGKLKD